MSGRVVVVTGASAGVGRATARALATRWPCWPEARRGWPQPRRRSRGRGLERIVDDMRTGLALGAKEAFDYGLVHRLER